LTLLSFGPNFFIWSALLLWYNVPVQYCASRSREAFLFWAMFGGTAKRLSIAPCAMNLGCALYCPNPKLNLRRHPCPHSVQRTAYPSVFSLSPMAAAAALPVPATIPISASTTLKKRPRPVPPNHSPKTSPPSSPATTSPPAISTLPSHASSPP